MSSKNQQSDEAKSSTDESSSVDNAAEENTVKKTVKAGTFIILTLILSSLAWYLLADRYTPYTQQARIDGYVVGISSEVSGVVSQVLVKNNQIIEEGQILFDIKSAQFEIALNKARSDLENVTRQIAAGTAGVESAESNLAAARANKKKAEQSVNRLEGLYKQDPGAISVRRLESSQSDYAQALAKVSGAEAEVVRAIEQKGGEGENNAKLKSATSAVNKAELDLKHTTTYASSAGVITDLRTDVGQYANAGNPLMTFISIHDIWIEAQFTENNLGHLKTGSVVEFVIDSLPG